jgi:S-adenosyl-L-methionine hydrolase (adenosine-forming)
MDRPLLALLTDFGTDSGYAAMLHALALEALPNLRIVDLSHGVPPHDVAEAAWLAYAWTRGLPPRPRLLLAVVDPGVGSPRAVIHVAAHGQEYIAPDNGLLELVIASDPAATVRRLPAAPATAGGTFHGRDHLLPMALTRLAGEWSPEDLPGHEPRRLPDLEYEPERRSGGWRGRVLHADRFGNLITNLREEHLRLVSESGGGAALARVQGPLNEGDESGTSPPRLIFQGAQIPLRRCYAEIGPGELAALPGSTGHLELALNCASALETFGRKVRLDLLPPASD